MVSSNNSINDTVGASVSGVTNTLTVTNGSNTASSAARATLVVGGTSSGNPTLNWNVSGSQNWEMGIDNADSRKWKLSAGTALGTNDTIVAFNAGQVLKPRQPAFFAYVNTTQSNVTGDGTNLTIVYENVLFNVGSSYNTSTGTFTVPVTGIYIFSFSAWFFGLSNSNGLGTMFLARTGSASNKFWGASSYFGVVKDANSAALFTSALPVQATAGDLLNVQVSVSGGPKNVSIIGQGNAGAGSLPCYFSGYLLG